MIIIYFWIAFKNSIEYASTEYSRIQLNTQGFLTNKLILWGNVGFYGYFMGFLWGFMGKSGFIWV